MKNLKSYCTELVLDGDALQEIILDVEKDRRSEALKALNARCDGQPRAASIESALERERAMMKALLRLEELGFFESSSAHVAETMKRHARSMLIASWGGRHPLQGPRKLNLFPDFMVHDFPALCLSSFGFEIEHVPRDGEDLAEEYLLRAFEGSFGLLEPKSFDVRQLSPGGLSGSYEARLVLEQGEIVRTFDFDVNFTYAFENFLNEALRLVEPRWTVFSPLEFAGDCYCGWDFLMYVPAKALADALELSFPDRKGPLLPVDIEWEMPEREGYFRDKVARLRSLASAG